MSSNLTLDQVAASQAQKEVAINDIFGQVDAAVTELLLVNLAAGNVAITAAQARRAMLLRTAGNAVARDLTLPQIKRELTIQNGGSATLSIKRGATTITLGAGLVTKVYTDGTTDGMVASGGGSGGGLVDAPSDGNTYGRTNGAWTRAQPWDADLDTWAAKAAPGGAAVGTTDVQALTNKTIVAGSNTISGLTTAMFAANVVDTDGTLAANSNTRVASQAAVKTYVDNAVSSAVVGLGWKSAVKAASTANLTLSGAQTVDGVALVAGDRILVKNQTTGSQNGIYVVAAGAWSRAADADTAAKLNAAAVMVTQGSTQADTQWNMNTDGVTLGTTALTWVQFGAASSYSPGTGLGLTGNTFNITDPELVALLGLASAANKLPYFTGAGTAALADFSAYGRSLVAAADDTAARVTLNLVIGTHVQAYDADLAAIAALASAADQAPYATGAGTWALMTVTAAARTVLDDTTTDAMLATLRALPTAGGTMTGDLLTNGARLAIGGVYAHVSGITPSLQVNDPGAGATMGITRWGNDAAQARVLLGKARGGANGTHGTVQVGDTVAEILFAGSTGSLFAPSASIQSVVQAAPSGSGVPSRLVFLTGSTGGIGERMRIDEAGNIGMGGANTVISAARHFRLRSYTVATVPLTAVANEMISVSDGTSNKRLAVYDGANWRWPDGIIVS